jgi:hypothetical protein
MQERWATPFCHMADCFEMQVGTNHLGRFVLVNRTSRRRTKKLKVSSWVVPAAIPLVPRLRVTCSIKLVTAKNWWRDGSGGGFPRRCQ